MDQEGVFEDDFSCCGCTSFDPCVIFYKEGVSAQIPHARVQLNALYKIPEYIIPRNNEPQNIPLHMKKLMECWRAGMQISDWVSRDIYFAYLTGVNEAVDRGQEALAVLEMPVDWNQDWRDWQEYLAWLIPQVSATDWVIGNEMWDKAIVQGERPNGRPTGWGNWSEYSRLFAEAYDKIKAIYPDTRIVLTAPHYYGRAEILQHQLDALDRQTQVRTKDGKQPITIDAVALHFYDSAQKLSQYIELQKNELRRRGLSVPTILTEFGRGAGERYSEEGIVFGNRPDELFKRVVTASAFVNADRLNSAYYYTALTDGVPMHSLFFVQDGVVWPTSLYKTFIYACKLGRSAVFQSAHNGKITFTTEIGNRAHTVSWHLRDEDPKDEIGKNWLVYDSTGTYPAGEDAVVVAPVGSHQSHFGGPASHTRFF